MQIFNKFFLFLIEKIKTSCIRLSLIKYYCHVILAQFKNKYYFEPYNLEISMIQSKSNLNVTHKFR